MEDRYKVLLEKYPFISYLTYGGNEYIGIIQNLDDVITSIYDFAAIKNDFYREKFLELGEIWWWESNRLIPINVFLKQEWAEFKPLLKTFNSKEVTIISGPCLSLKEIANKRSKRRSITLVRKIT